MRRFQTALWRIKNKKGVTLVELIMVMAIMAILGVAVMTLTTSSLGMYNKGRDLITKEEVAKIVEGYVSAKVEKAITVKISSDKKSVDVTSKAGSAKIGTANTGIKPERCWQMASMRFSVAPTRRRRKRYTENSALSLNLRRKAKTFCWSQLRCLKRGTLRTHTSRPFRHFF